MVVADEFQAVNEAVAIWQAYAPAVKCDLTSTYLTTASGGIFVDPIGLGKLALAELVEIAAPVAIVLTNGNHARAAETFRTAFSIPIIAHHQAVSELELTPDRTLGDGEAIVPGLVAIEIAGAVAGEIALHSSCGVLTMGDALIHLPPYGFSLLPEKYCLEAKAMRLSLRNLLRFEFEVMTFAHGLPLLGRARLHLQSLLA